MCDFPPAKRIKLNEFPIEQLPDELLELVFKCVSFAELSLKVRLVNRRFKRICELVLNQGFKHLKHDLEDTRRKNFICLEQAREDLDVTKSCKLLNFVELAQSQYSIVNATIWRYVFNKYYLSCNLACFYGGVLLDFYYEFLRKVGLNEEASLTRTLKTLVFLTKKFCVHFDRTIEEPLVNCTILSGCKAIDLLDTALFAHKTTSKEFHTNKMFYAKYYYFFENSWFVAIPIIKQKNFSNEQKQRLMHMRLRRITVAHNEMALKQAQYHREVFFRTNPQNRIKKPGNNVYTGFGDVEDLFFYYGTMNEGAYFNKFKLEDEELESDEDLEDLYEVAYLGLVVKVNVQCPLVFAPENYLKKLKDCEINDDSKRILTQTHINMVFDCHGSSYPRLPSRYEYDFTSQQFL